MPKDAKDTLAYLRGCVTLTREFWECILTPFLEFLDPTAD
jgi:hypothetical protein